MTEKLKTLKDLNIEEHIVMGKEGIYKSVQLNELKAEAIKWFKDGVKCINTDDVKKCDCAAEFIKKFFNLTEEDLK